MSDKSHIEWTEATWNPVTGCTKVSQGCKNCYAERDWKRLAANPTAKAYFGRPFTNVQCHPERLDQPLRWTRPRRIFVNSMSDLFHEDVPFEFVADVFAAMACTTRHTYQILTKRPERMREWFRWAEATSDSFGFPESVDPLRIWPQWTPHDGKRSGYDNCGPTWPLENVWLGVSVEDQATAGERIPPLLETPAAVRWISAEPLLSPVDLTRLHFILHNAPVNALKPNGCVQHAPGYCLGDCPWRLPGLDWIVAGGESGPRARPTHPDWVRSLRDQCQAAGVAFFFKQWGEWLPHSQWPTVAVGPDLVPVAPSGFGYEKNQSNARGWMVLDDRGLIDVPDGYFPEEEKGLYAIAPVGKKRAGRQLDGRTWDEVPT